MSLPAPYCHISGRSDSTIVDVWFSRRRQSEGRVPQGHHWSSTNDGRCFAYAWWTRVDMRPEDLIGVWLEKRSGEHLVFNEDNGFAATNLPYQEFEGFSYTSPDWFDPKRHKLPGMSVSHHRDHRSWTAMDWEMRTRRLAWARAAARVTSPTGSRFWPSTCEVP